MPFAVISRMTKCPEIALTKEEQKELGDSFKQVLDIYAPAWLEKHGALILFGSQLSIIAGTKYMLYEEAQKKKEAQNGIATTQTGQ